MLGTREDDDPHGARRQSDIRQLQRIRACLDAADEVSRPVSEILDDIARLVADRDPLIFQPKSWR